MVTIYLQDGTSYNIDTESEAIARSVVEYKLRDRLDVRKISNAMNHQGNVAITIESPNYNSGNAYDGKELKAATGRDYSWDDNSPSTKEYESGVVKGIMNLIEGQARR